MLDRGAVDAFIGWEPASAAAIAKSKDAHYVAQWPPIPNAESLQLVFQPKIAKDNPDLIVRFLRASLRGMSYIKANSKENVADLLAKKMNDPSLKPIAVMALGSVAVTDPRLDMPSTRIILQTISEQGKIAKELVSNVDAWLGKYLDYSFLEKAEQTLKKWRFGNSVASNGRIDLATKALDVVYEVPFLAHAIIEPKAKPSA